MTNEQRLDWSEGGLEEAEEKSRGGRRVLHVGDGHLGFLADMGDVMSVSDALHDYAEGYDSGKELKDIRVDWLLYQNGVNTDGGHWGTADPRPITGWGG